MLSEVCSSPTKNGLTMTKNISYVPQNDLCTGCGICFSICPEQSISMQINDKKGIIYPEVDREKCASCGICLNVCPGIDADFNQDVPKSWLSLDYHQNTGYYSSIYLGYSNNKELQFNGASGGIVTAFLLYLLEENLIDGAVVTRMNDSNPLRGEPFIAKTKEEIIMAQKSKYCPVSLGKILKELENQSGNYAVVGLPCHINGIRKIQKHNKDLKDKISFLIGLFCSRTPTFNATLHLLRKKGIAPNKISFLEYRGQGHPGFMTIGLNCGKLIRIPHLDYDYWGYMFYKFFIPPRCFLCPDKLAANADIAMGDNWSHLLRHTSGSSTIVVREPSCRSIINTMEKKYLITLQEIDLYVLLKSQDLESKCRIAPRIKLWNFVGGSFPNYGNLEILKENTLINMLYTLPQFIRFLLTRRKINYVFFRAISRTFWTIDKALQIFFRILAITRKFFAFFYKFFINSLIPIKLSPLVKKSKYKIVMIGGFGARDIGDEAMPHADRINLKKLLSNELDIVMFSPDPEYTQLFHGEQAIKDLNEVGQRPRGYSKAIILNLRATLCSLFFILATIAEKYGIHLRLWPSARNVLNELISCDLVFNVGGGNLNSVIPQELYKKGTLYLASYILGKPVILSGQTIGPFTNWCDKIFAKFCLNKVHMITFRDKEVSHNRLKEIGVSRPTTLDAADDAMTIPSISKRVAENILISEAGEEWGKIDAKLTVALNLKGSLKIFSKIGKCKGLHKEVQLMAKIADVIIELFKSKVIFVPTDYCPGVDDREVHSEIISKMHNKNFARSIDGEYDDSTLKGLLALFDLAIGARYHFCVFAASMHVPFLGIASGVYQQTKLKGLADLCGLPQCFINNDMESSTFQEVWPKIEKFINERKFIKQKLKEIVPVLEEKSTYGIKEAAKLLID